VKVHKRLTRPAGATRFGFPGPSGGDVSMTPQLGPHADGVAELARERPGRRMREKTRSAPRPRSIGTFTMLFVAGIPISFSAFLRDDPALIFKARPEHEGVSRRTSSRGPSLGPAVNASSIRTGRTRGATAAGGDAGEEEGRREGRGIANRCYFTEATRLAFSILGSSTDENCDGGVQWWFCKGF